MFNEKKNTYTLDYIEKLFTYIPKIFIIIIGFLLILLSYILLDIDKKRTLDLIEQKQILNYEFSQKNKLNNFIGKVNQKVNKHFSNVKRKLKKIVYKTIGYLDAKYSKLDTKDLYKYLIKIEKQQNIKFVIFQEKDLNIIHGENSILTLQKNMFNTDNKNKFKTLLLMYISSQGKNNLQSWKYDFHKNMLLSFFDILELNNTKLYIGAFSTVENIQQITKESIIKSILNMKSKANYNIWFYNSITQQTFNYNNTYNKNSAFAIIKTKNYKLKKYQILKYYSLNDNGKNKEFEKSVHIYSKYPFLVSIEYDKQSILKSNQLKINKIENKYKNIFYKMTFYIILLISILLLFSFLFSNFIKKIFGKYNRSLQKKTDLLKYHKKKVELLVIEEVEKNRKKDRLLIQQSKLASMGSMLENIAHQWRQPLNNVNLILHFLRDNYKNKDFSKEQLEKYINKSKIQIDYMSQTIDDFRDFYQPSKIINNFNISLVIQDVLKITKEQFIHDNIKIILDLNDIFILNYENELKQTLLNILNNAKDAIVLKRKRNLFEAYIKIKVIQNKEFVKITIENDGGKIKKEIIEKIFEPYFTTRAEILGTGIGLYMAKMIIETNMKGKISVENIKDGVSFSILLPLKSN
jgi:signal transduction histidine kinase